ncbi:hypothetical protein [Nocardiopsis sp. YSL2]|uniref:hypothetical protein n=1 Tax=Nocardiopsis sp. YSL2 TaxID=2939492 RepID=UPI0026F461DC|nr:hypothetical protein [Nocardiopsis sp. YSL2]
MTHLWIKIENADNITKARAVRALEASGLEVHRAHLGEHDPETVREIEQRFDIRRDWAGIALGAVLAAGFGAGAWQLWALGGWWIAGAVVCAIVAAFGLVGFASDLQKKPRETKGTSS